MSDNKLEIEEAQRAANYEAIKSSAKADVRQAVVTEPVTVNQSERVEEMADEMRRFRAASLSNHYRSSSGRPRPLSRAGWGSTTSASVPEHTHRLRFAQRSTK